MKPLFWVLLWSMRPNLALFSGLDHCALLKNSTSQSVSPLLESLQCYNDYTSHVHCKWRQHKNRTVELWVATGTDKTDRKLCVPFSPSDAAEHITVHCRYTASAFSIGIEHTAFFIQNKTLSVCSSVQRKSLNLFQHLSARPPVDLSTHDTGDGGRKLIWSSPYPTTSSLNKNLTYQLSYKTYRQDNWTTVDVTNTSVTLERPLLLPGHKYEARVRSRASVGQWSDWSPVVTWWTKKDFGQFPPLHCVLDGEKEVMCSWEVSTELAQIITYQLVCRHNENAPSERCCLNPAVTPNLNEMILRYSCSLTVADPEHLLLDLLPTYNTKSFEVHKHIHPNPPVNVTVRESNSNWIVEWTKPTTAERCSLYYQVCYYRTQDQGFPVLLNHSEEHLALTILGLSLAPHQHYQVKVRSVVVPGSGSKYGGIPSEWTDPVEWTSNEVFIWSPTTLIYSFIGVFVAAVFLFLYCTVPACQRKVILWVDSVPSPGKSKILSEFKSPSSQTFIQSEKLSICKVQQLDVLSTCSSEALLWPTKDTEKKFLDQDEGCWNCDSLPPHNEEVNIRETSSMSFSGPYIFCQSPESIPKSMNVKNEDRETETPPDDLSSTSPVNFTLFGEGYVCLPNRGGSRSTQDLVSHSSVSTSTSWHDSATQDQKCIDMTSWPVTSDIQLGFSEPTLGNQPPEYTSGSFTNWPEGATIQASGYCHLPTDFTRVTQ